MSASRPAAVTPPDFTTLTVTLENAVARVTLNRPDKANAMNAPMWVELKAAMEWLDETPQARVGIITGAGRFFTAGIDLAMLGAMKDEVADGCDGRRGEKLRRQILDIQDTVTSVERCRKPVIAAVNGPCVGGGIDLITACDMRYAADDAWFSVKEVDMGLAADVGTLQRLPKIVGEGMARELAYTARKVTAAEAEAMQLINRRFPTVDALNDGVLAIAAGIAAKSPLAIRGTKEMITYVRDHSVADGLNYIATWNAAMLLSDDLTEAMTAFFEKRPASFRD
ncbi:MAG: enoyl-CoA hydratase [Tistrella sp.]|uniref:Crotonase/enoyl-CoA hydratase family protein n=1 Tax=Tistrella mobilis TaxID=171437 RepID=A0A3B9IT87_9PROT|nr:crotonase/enoyl-CoA hydratase family protein [Tistrella sp.]MAD35503.1 enoyl-CoA hydratase [Tistrella sp.]MBA78424.1 enoyl-CoA hydratase [Tistrella sp.]HAE50996.1 crotonase/enoyl-CoA hydratase family protein [Tistrella mobilis]